MIDFSERPLASFAAGADPQKATRDGYGEALLVLGERDPRVVVLDADLARSTRTEWWMKRFPDRFLNAGIAEQNLIGMAAGLASVGWVPFATTYAIFVARAFDQIRQSVSYAGTNVKIVGSHGGYAASFDGGSHQGLEDVALMTVLPGMTVLCPLDHADTVRAVEWAASYQGAVYLRTQKEPAPDFTGGERPVPFPAVRQWGSGEDLALVATGSRVHPSLCAAAMLESEGRRARVLGLTCLKPFPEEAVRGLAAARAVLVVEEHMMRGGLFDSVCAALRGTGTPIKAVAARDRYGETGAWHRLLEENGMDAAGIHRASCELLSRHG